MYREAGFTLVEIVIVMAISVAMALAAFAGFSSLRGNAQFTSSIERAKESLVSAKNEANTTVNATVPETAAGRSDDRIILGRAVVFMGHGQGQYLTYDLIGGDEDNPKPIEVARTSSTTMSWGVALHDPTAAPNEKTVVAFMRTPVGVQAFVFRPVVGSISGLESALVNPSNYNPPPGAATETLVFTGESGRRADVRVTVPAGLIEREYQL